MILEKEEDRIKRIYKTITSKGRTILRIRNKFAKKFGKNIYLKTLNLVANDFFLFFHLLPPK